MLPESLCAPDMLTIGDAWRAIEAERRRVPVLLECNELLECPKRLAAVLSHLRFIQREGKGLEGVGRKTLEAAIEMVAFAREEAVGAALKGEAGRLREIWEEVAPHVKLVGGQIPEALRAGASLAEVRPNSGALGVRLTSAPVLQRGVATEYTFRLVGPKGERLKLGETGTRLHAVVANESLTDFHHEHPSPGNTEGEWCIRFTPMTDEPYRAWIQGIPAAGQRAEVAITNLTQTGAAMIVPPSEKVEKFESAAGGIRAHLSFPVSPPVAGMPVLGRLKLKVLAQEPLSEGGGGDGTTVQQITAVSEDLLTIIHLHPAAPTAALDRGSGSFDFYFEAPSPGFYRLFLSMSAGAQELPLRFGIKVGKAPTER